MEQAIILLIDSDNKRVKRMQGVLHSEFEVITANNQDMALDLFKLMQSNIRVVLLHINNEASEALDFLEKMKQNSLFAEFIVYSEKEDLDLALEVMRKGAYDYIPETLLTKKLIHSIEHSLEASDILKRIRDYVGIQFVNKIGGNKKLWYLQEILAKRKKQGRIISTEEIIAIFNSNIDNNLAANKGLLNKFGFEKSVSDKGKILLIEDDIKLAESIKLVIGSEYDVIIAKDGKTGVRYIKKQADISVVMLDINLPDASGKALLPKLKLLNQEVEIIVMSTFSSIDDAIKLLRAGAFDYLDKPFNKDHLKSSIARAMQKISLKHFLPEFYKRFVENNISYKCKMSMLRDLVRQRNAEEKYLLMEDIYLFFPDLAMIGIDCKEKVKSNFDDEGLTAFIEHLRSRIKTT
jgi:DNA-binding NtrC family response regulator